MVGDVAGDHGSGDDRTVVDVQTQLWTGRYAQCGILVERAVERGELPAQHTDARSLLIAATAPLHHQLVLLRADPDPHLPERAA